MTEAFLKLSREDRREVLEQIRAKIDDRNICSKKMCGSSGR